MSITPAIREAFQARPHKTKRYSCDPNDALVLAGNIGTSLSLDTKKLKSPSGGVAKAPRVSITEVQDISRPPSKSIARTGLWC